MSNLLVAVARNEAPFLLQWVAWHRLVGFDAILIYTNDCDDPTEAMLDRLHQLGLVSWERNRAGFGEAPQLTALADLMDHPLYRVATWVAHFDLDEYLVVHAGDGTLNDLYARIGDANMLSVSWRNFGDSGRQSYTPGLLLEQFTWCAPRYLQRPRQLTAIKTLHKPLGHWARLGPHRPFDLRADPDQVVWVNGDGAPMPRSFLKVGWQSEPGFFGDALVQLNHYAIKSRESYLTKVARGSPRRGKQRVDFDYWCLRNINFEQDHTAQRHLPTLRRDMQALLDDPVLGPLQIQAEAGHRNEIDRLRRDPAYAELFQRLVDHVPHGRFERMTDGERTVYSFFMPDVAEPAQTM